MSAIDLSALGVAVGHATDAEGATGLTVLRPIAAHTPMRGAAAVVGRATATREVHTLAADHLAARVDAILLTGGSAYGLDAAAGVMRWLEEHGRGFPVPGGVVPIVPAAAVFDLVPCGRFDARPHARMAYDACASALSRDIAEGSVGAGTGCTVGKAAGRTHAMKGGFGCSLEEHGDVVVAALAVVNAFGDVRDSDGRIIAGARNPQGGWFDSAALVAQYSLGSALPLAESGHQTTLCAIVTNAALPGAELHALARASAAALYRRITPAGTAVDGDIVFVMAPQTAAATPPSLARIEALAVRALESAIERAVRLAKGRDGIPGLADV